MRTRVSLSLSLSLSPSRFAAADVPESVRIDVRPFEDSLDGFTGSLFHVFLRPYFLESRRPVRIGDTFIVCAEHPKGVRRSVDFKV